MTKKEAQTRNWNIFMFRGMAKRICNLTLKINSKKLTNEEKITIVKFNKIMIEEIDYLDSIKKHKHRYGIVFNLGKDLCADCGKIKHSRGYQKQCF